MKTRRVGYPLAAAAAVFASLVVAGPASADSAICGTSVTNNLTLTANVTCSSTNAPAITVVSSGVTINLNGYTITGKSNQDVIEADWTCGNGSQRCDNVTVENGTITGGSAAVALGGDDDVATGLTLTGDRSGVAVDGGAGDLITGSTITGALDAVDLDFASGTTVSQNTLGMSGVGNGNEDGLYSDGDVGDTITDNYAAHNSNVGLQEDYGDQLSFSDNVVSGSGENGVYLFGDHYGNVTLADNASRSNAQYGFDLYYVYAAQRYTGASSLISGNYANLNGEGGYYDLYSLGATWENNSAGWNTGDGYYWAYGAGETIANNISKYNTSEGYEIDITNYDSGSVANDAALAVTGNSATYNGDYGFLVDSLSQAGSGNTGGGTNTSGDCYGLSGCS